MTNSINVKFDSKKFEKALKQAPKKTAKALNDGLEKSSLVVQNQAKKNSPIARGDLRRSITKEIKNLVATVGSNKIYARIQEFGGTIRPKNKKYLHFQIKGKWIKTTIAIIPPYRNKGYLRPALKSSLSKIEDIFGNSLKTIFA